MVSCPLCQNPETTRFFQWPASLGCRDFHHCPVCDLRFVPAASHLSPEDERRFYETHNNDPYDAGYRRFLAPVLRYLRPGLQAGARGLDFGAGPGPALAMMLEEAGFSVQLYDRYFHPNADALTQRYNFITCTETMEHLARPAEVLALFARLLQPGGLLVVMSSRLRDWDGFPTWNYHRDPTHIAFYSEECWRWIAREFGLSVQFPEGHLVMLSAV